MMDGDRARESVPEDESCLIVYPVSAMDCVLKAEGWSEVAKFMKRGKYSFRQVECLPDVYDGDIIFELPPLKRDCGKGSGLRDMDRASDCYYWNRIVPTSVNVAPKDIWFFGKSRCTGSLICLNDACPYYVRDSIRNCIAWIGSWKISVEHKVGNLIPEGGVLCGHCNLPPVCDAECPALMFYMYPRFGVSGSTEMSRLAIHMGGHSHPCRRTFSRASVKKAAEVIRREVVSNPSAHPSRIKNGATGSLMKEFLDSDTAKDFGEDDEKHIWESLKVIASPRKFHSLIRSVRMDNPKLGILHALQQIQRNVKFPFLQRYLLPGQGSRSDRAHIFKMSVKGRGSGLDLLIRMLPGGSLYGCWAMFDVMHRITTDLWHTMTVSVYDHCYRALCTIFTCELMAEDTESFEVAWRSMIDVARENGVEEVHIYGFMADNAQAGWAAVRNVFFGGMPNAARERTDAFHHNLSVSKHTIECIIDGKQAEFLEMWDTVRNASSYRIAYAISNDISFWWREGHAIPTKIKELEAWKSWWVNRWRQWGSLLRRVSMSRFLF